MDDIVKPKIINRYCILTNETLTIELSIPSKSQVLLYENKTLSISLCTLHNSFNCLANFSFKSIKSCI